MLLVVSTNTSRHVFLWVLFLCVIIDNHDLHLLQALALSPSASTKECSSQRRRLFQTALLQCGILGSTTSTRQICCAEDVPTSSSAATSSRIRPYAPTTALLPATRCKLWLDKAQTVALSLQFTKEKTGDDMISQRYQALQELNNVLQHRPTLFVDEPPLPRRTSSGSTAQLTTPISSASKSESRKTRQSYFNVGDRVAAALNQADVERQWGMLQYTEAQKEASNPIRAAFNYYTQQLQFDNDRYLLTASKEDKKRMIRNDELPSITSVVVSDLDLRDLYRNQLLTAVEDLQAEVAYQVRQAPKEVDLTDVLELMTQASVACQKWFDLIDENDVAAAMDQLKS